MDDQDCIKIEGVSFQVSGRPRVTFGLELPDAQSVTVEVTVVPPNDSVVFKSYDQIMALARLELSKWLDGLASQARKDCPTVF